MTRTLRLQQLPAAGLLVACSLIVPACGDDASGSPSAPAPSEAAYVAEGNALCERIGGEIQAVFPDFPGEPTVEQVMKLAADLSPVLQDWRRSVSALAPPSSAERGHAQLLAALQSSIASLDDAAKSADGARALLDAGGPPLDAPANAAHQLFERCPAGDAG